jgi:hypothetical protein
MGSVKKPVPKNLKPRYEPPTLEEALFAAEGLTDDRDEQVAIAAGLMDLPHDCVFHKAEAYFKAQKNRVTVEAAHRPGAEVVVETRSRSISLERRGKAPIAAFSFERKSTAPRFVVETRTTLPKRIITLPR